MHPRIPRPYLRWYTLQTRPATVTRERIGKRTKTSKQASSEEEEENKTKQTFSRFTQSRVFTGNEGNEEKRDRREEKGEEEGEKRREREREGESDLKEGAEGTST